MCQEIFSVPIYLLYIYYIVDYRPMTRDCFAIFCHQCKGEISCVFFEMSSLLINKSLSVLTLKNDKKVRDYFLKTYEKICYEIEYF